MPIPRTLGLAVEASVGPFMMDSTPPSRTTPRRLACDLAVEYMGVADALARRFRCPGHDAEDLRQVARLGLVKAAQRYRAYHGHGFVAFAVPTITGELKRYVRDQAWIVRPPRGVQELRLKVNAVTPQLTQTLGHQPTTLELSRELCVSPREVAEAQMADASMVSEPIDHDGSSEDPGQRPIYALAAEDPGYGLVEYSCTLASALAKASEEDLELLRLRFLHGRTQDEIAEHLGVSQMQVSRLLRRVLSRLRRRMAS